MIIAGAILLAVAALWGAILATLHLRDKHVSLALALGHGMFAAAGVALLVWAAAVRHNFGGLLGASLLLFVVAAVGGAYMFYRHGMNRRIPPALILGHGAIALTGYIVLLIQILG